MLLLPEICVPDDAMSGSGHTPCGLVAMPLAVVVSWPESSLGQVVQICHTRWECTVVPSVFARHHNCGSRRGVCWFRVGDDS